MVFVWISMFYGVCYFTTEIFNISCLLDNYVTLSYINLILIFWVLFTLVLIYSNISSNWLTSTMLYLFGMYRTFLSNTTAASVLVFKNLTLSLNFFIYNLIDFIKFLPKNQIWIPIYKRFGYISLFNSSRTRWQLSKSHSMFKNK